MVFGIGRPTGTGPVPVVTGWTSDQMVVSVGPYMFQTAMPRTRRASARSRVRGSPPHSTRRPGWPGHPVASRARQVAGVACMTVQPDAAMAEASR